MPIAMRWIFALLLLGNIAFFAAMQLSPQNKAGADAPANHTPYRAEKIRLIAENEIPKAAPVAPPPAPELVCLEWGQFSDQELTRAKAALQALKLDERAISIHNAPAKANSWWVYIAPRQSKLDANRKVEELRQLGIPDSFVIQDRNKWRYAVSIGVFSTQEAANKYLAQIKEKGVKSAQSGPRNPEASPASIVVKTGGAANIEEELVKLKLGFPATELKAVPCSP